jgi:hypothetical protein
MRTSTITRAAILALAVTSWPSIGLAQPGHDFIFTDEEGHLLLRFANAGHDELLSAPLQPREEILSQELSVMVHDRMRADLSFEAEAVDPDWAGLTKFEIESHLHETTAGFSSRNIECRSETCRVILQHRDRFTISEHEKLLEKVQAELQALIDAAPEKYDPVFLITAYEQASTTPHIKAFLRRATATR